MNSSIVVLGLLVLLSSGGCQRELDGPTLDLSSRNNDFAARLYRVAAGRSDDNVLLSPYTLSIGLSALLSATNGSTQEQLLQGLSLSGLDPQLLPGLFQSLGNVTVPVGAGLKQAVAILPAHDVQVSPAYLDLVQTKLGGKVQTLTYSAPQEAADTINRWVQEQTGVQDLLTNLDPQTQLLLAAATSYQAAFSLSFNSSLTQDERFYVDRYHVVIVPMMFRVGSFFLAYDPSLKVGVLKLSMADGAAMLVVLPDEDVDIHAVEEDVTVDKIQAWIRQLKKTKLEVLLPRFLLERSYSLSDVLQALDITKVFQDDADINMGGAKGSKLTQVFHKATISVDEQSSADTTGSGGSIFSTRPPQLTINRPFIFLVYQETSKSLLLMGRVVDPTLK